MDDSSCRVAAGLEWSKVEGREQTRDDSASLGERLRPEGTPGLEQGTWVQQGINTGPGAAVVGLELEERAELGDCQLPG